MKTVYRVWYWDPCNGMMGRSKDCGLFSTEDKANEWIRENRDPSPMEDKAYKVVAVEVR